MGEKEVGVARRGGCDRVERGGANRCGGGSFDARALYAAEVGAVK